MVNQEKITNDKLEKFRLNFSKCANLAPSRLWSNVTKS